MRKVLLVIVLALVSSTAPAAVYYIDYAGGSDSNNGTSKSTPWKLAPGMQGCLRTDTNDNNCRARTHAGADGDTFIFKGGVTWPKECFSFDWYFGNTTTFTVDATWYTGASWSRPVFDSEGVEPTANPETGVTRTMRAYGTGHVINNLEFKGLVLDHGIENGHNHGLLLMQAGSGTTTGELKNCYFHGWSRRAVDGDGKWIGGSDDGEYAADSIVVTELYYEGSGDGWLVHGNVWDGADTTGDMGRLLLGGGHVYNNYFAEATIAIFTSGYVWGNTFKNIDSTTNFMLYPEPLHGNMLEINKGWVAFYNNYVSESHYGNLLLYQIDGHGSYIFNNVITGDNGQTVQIGNINSGQTTLTTGDGAPVLVFNNTLHQDNGVSFASIAAGGPHTESASDFSVVMVANNHLISDTHGNYFATSVMGNLTITGATQANPVVITYTTSGVDPQNGWVIYISGVSGMTQLNGTFFTVTSVDAENNTFALSGIDGTAYGEWASGGTVYGQFETGTVGMTSADATEEGYIPGGSYPYYPVSGGSTVDSGLNLSAVCSTLVDSGPSSPSTACLSDTTLGVSYNATTHTVTGDGRTAAIRSSWDVGAYEYQTSGTATLNGSGAVTLGGSGTVTIE